MKIKMRMNSGVAYKTQVDAKTLEEAADYISTVKWLKTNDDCIVFTSHITMIKDDDN